MIVVTGATGKLGQRIVEALLQRAPAERIAASARDPAKAATLSQRGVRVRAADFRDPQSLSHAFEGATQVLIISSNAAAYGGDPLAQHQAAIDAARSAGARRLVYTSHMAASATSKFPPMRVHAATEEMLRRSGLAWTALRNGFYASSGIDMLGNALKTGVIEAPADGKVSWTVHADLAEAAAAVLAEEGLYDGATPSLTGSEALDFADVARIASDVLGRPVRREHISDEEFRARVAERGAPPVVQEIALGYYRASREGEFAAMDPTLEQLLGRRPIPLRDLIARAAAD